LNLESELKIRADRLDDVEKRIIELGGAFEGEEFQTDIYYQHPCRDFSETDEAIRVRYVGEKVELTYKGPRMKSEIKRREEVSLRIGEGDVKTLLRRLGFREVAKVNKRRRNYLLEGLKVSLDMVEGLGEFIEVELVKKVSIKHLKELLDRMGVPWRPEERTYLELLLNKSSPEA
jgi:adenylate cyclase class 2